MKPVSFWRDVQFRLEYVVLRLVVGIVRAFPLPMATAISARTWRWLAPALSPKRHRRALDNLAIAFPDMPERERRRIALDPPRLDRLERGPGVLRRSRPRA